MGPSLTVACGQARLALVNTSYEVDMEKAMGQVEDILGEGFSELLGETGGMIDLSGKVPFAAWLGKDDKLMRKVQFQMEGEAAGQDYEMTMTMTMFDYGEPVDIPSLEEMLERVGS